VSFLFISYCDAEGKERSHRKSNLWEIYQAESSHSYSKKLGGEALSLYFFFISIYAYKLIQKRKRISNSEYVKGISLGVDRGVKGSYYLYYSFKVNDETYKGNVTTDFCKKCNCCKMGDTVIVRFESEDPENNDLVLKLPSDAHFDRF